MPVSWQFPREYILNDGKCYLLRSSSPVAAYITLPPSFYNIASSYGHDVIHILYIFICFLYCCYSNNKFLKLGMNALLSFCRQYFFSSPTFCWVIASLNYHNSTFPQQNYFVHITNNPMGTSFWKYDKLTFITYTYCLPTEDKLHFF